LLGRLGIADFRIELNSIGDRACRPAYIAELRDWLAAHSSELDEETREKAERSPLRVFDTKNPHVAEALVDAPKIGESLCDDCLRHFSAVQRYLTAYGVRYELVPTLVRGLDYYSRTTFEFTSRSLGAQDALVGGGRYDYLVEEIGGPPTPALGFGAGIERLVIALAQDDTPPKEQTLDVFLVCADEDLREVLRAMQRLREAGISADKDYAGRSFNGQLKLASRLNPRTTAVVSGVQAEMRRRGKQDFNVSLNEPDFVDRVRAALA